ncbi:unnamed protein product [Prunus armeniaca]
MAAQRREKSGLNQSILWSGFKVSGGKLGGLGSGLREESIGTGLVGRGSRTWQRCSGFRLSEQ